MFIAFERVKEACVWPVVGRKAVGVAGCQKLVTQISTLIMPIKSMISELSPSNKQA